MVLGKRWLFSIRIFSRGRNLASREWQKILCCLLINTHYHNSNLIWRTVSRRVNEVIPSDHPRRVAGPAGGGTTLVALFFVPS